MAAHVAVPAYLRDVLLPQGRILGWSQDWFAGYPVFYFYFPLPSLVIVLLDVVLPYGVAFKVATISGLLATPPADLLPGSQPAIRKSRCRRWPRRAVPPSSSWRASRSTEPMFSRPWRASSRSRGRWPSRLLYLAFLIRSIRDDPRYVPWPDSFWPARSSATSSRSSLSWRRASTVLLWKGACGRRSRCGPSDSPSAGFWVVPLLARLGFSSDMAWIPLRSWDQLFPLEIWLLLPARSAEPSGHCGAPTAGLPLMALTLLPDHLLPAANRPPGPAPRDLQRPLEAVERPPAPVLVFRGHVLCRDRHRRRLRCG